MAPPALAVTLLKRTAEATLLVARADPQQQQVDENDSPYNYNPHLSLGIIFVVVFGLSFLLNVGLAIRYRLWWAFATLVLCSVGETIGWIGRTWSAKSPNARDPFLMQITTTIFSPTFLVAANFIILSQIIKYIGPQYSRLKAKVLAIVFLSADTVALVVQAIGGSMAASAETLEAADKGGNVMLGGIVFQLFIIILYSLFGAEIFYRYRTNKPFRSSTTARAPITPNVKLLMGTLAFTTLVIFIRSVYRVIELIDGWNGRIISTERYFVILDGVMIVLAVYTHIIFYPGRLLPARHAASASKMVEHDPEQSAVIAGSEKPKVSHRV